MGKKRIAVVEGLFAETAAGPRLLGSRCRTCAAPYFPASPVCHNPDCKESKMTEASFGPRGRLWSVAVQHYPPPPPARYDEPFRPYALGIVDLEQGLRVMARISSEDPQSVEVGTEVELLLEALCHDEDGNEIVTWKFRPL